MKQNIWRYFVLLFCLMTVAGLLSCTGGNGGRDGTEGSGDTSGRLEETDPDRIALSGYRIVISDRAESDLHDSTMRLAALIRDLTGTTVPVREDRSYAEDPEVREILVGATDRSACAEALSAVQGQGYVIQNLNGTVIINGTTDTVTADAVEYFLHNIVRKTAGNGAISIAQDYRYVQEYTRVDLSGNRYIIVYSESLDDDADPTFANGGLDYEVQLAIDLQETLSKQGINAAVATDKTAPAANEILIGSTNRAESASFLAGMDGTQYGVGYANGKLVLAGHSTQTTAMAVEKFEDMLDEDHVLTLGAHCIRSNSDWVLNVPPFPAGSLTGTQECGFDEVMFHYKNTSADDFSAYCDLLQGKGYQKTFSNTIEKNQFALLQSKYTRIYISYSGEERVTRLIAGKPGGVLYPKDAGADCEKITDISITQIQLDYSTNSGGMGYIITLEDGSFLMVDSGSTTSSGAAKNGKENLDHVRIWNLLNQLNKRSDKKIIIRGWFITHEHSDHIWVFRKFCEEYGSKVTIENYYSCVVPKSVAYNAKNPEYHVVNGKIGELRGKVNGGMQFVALHTGMKFSLYGLNIEILFTGEDHYPTRLHYFNDSSMCFTLSVPDQSADGKYQVLITGDIFTNACRIMLKRYPGATLKSDIVQVAHHGNQGATKAFYIAVDPKIALWPTSESLFQSFVAGDGTTSYYVIDRYLYAEMGVVENYTNSDYSVELKLPYTTGSATKHKVPATEPGQ